MKSKSNRAIAFCAFFYAIFQTSLFAQVFDENFDHWPLNTTINGTLIIDNGLKDKTPLFDSLRGLEGSKVLIVANQKIAASTLIKMQLVLKEKGANVSTRFFEKFASSLLDDIDKHSLVVFYGIDGFCEDESEHQQLLECRKSIYRFVMQGNKLILNQPISKMFCAFYSFDDSNSSGKGSNQGPCLVDCNIDFAFEHNEQSKAVLTKHLANSPIQNLRIGLTENVAMRISGRKVTVFGDGSATFALPACDHLGSQVQTIVQRTSRRMPPDKWLIDLTQWKRCAIDRTLDPFPPERPKTPFVKNGTLVIVGGGGMPRGLMNDFIEFAGGKEKAKLVYIPCSEQESVSPRAGPIAMWQRMGVQHAVMLHTKDRNKANTDEEFLAPLKDASGIWFGGGRQWNFADSYYGTKAHKLMKDVLKRGGVIGGSSAGASIQARFLARATPIGNTSILAPGYERGGLGFISGVAIDQHFTQRGRQKDQTQLVNKYPQLLGIGIDEATALIVQKSEAKIVGRGQVFFYDRTKPIADGEPDYISLPAGSVYDLAERKVVKDTTEQKDGGDDK